MTAWTRKLGPLRACAIFICLLPARSEAGDLIQGLHLLGQTGYFSLTSKSASRSASVSGYGAHSAAIEVAVKDRWKVLAGLSYTLSKGFGGDSATGYDLGVKYFFLSNSSRKIVHYDAVTWLSEDLWRPYVGLALRNREFFAVLSTTYVGFGALAGLDYSLTQDLFLNAEVRYDTMASNSNTTLIQNNFMLGIGLFLK